MKTHLAILFAAIAMLFVSGRWAAADTSYQITDLGVLQGGMSSYGYGINASGEVTGYVYTTSTIVPTELAFSYSGGQMTSLGTLGGTYSYGYGINDSGQITGYAGYNGGDVAHAFLYSAGIMSNLGTLGGMYSYGYGINASGQVTGVSYVSGNMAEHAFLYSGGTMNDLHTLGGTFSYGEGINTGGQVAGYSETTNNAATHAFLYSGGVMNDLGSVTGYAYSYGLGINASGQVAGFVYNIANGAQHAFLYSGGVMNDLGALPGFPYSQANGLNDNGQVAGYVYNPTSGAEDATLYSGGVMTDLNSAIPPSSGWALSSAAGINNAGQITGVGTFNGDTHAFLLTPVPPSAWTGAADATWATPGNWTGNVPGSTSGTTNTDTAAFNQNAPRSPLAIDSGRNVQNITFDTANVNSLTLGTTNGSPLRLTSGGTIQTTSTVANSQVVNAPLVLEGNYTFASNATTIGATLTFGGGITPAATSGETTLTLNGSNTGANTLSGVLADNPGAPGGKLAVSVGGSSRWVFDEPTSSNAYSGGTTIAGGATLELAGSVSALDQSMNIVNNSTSANGLHITGTNQMVGTITGSGNAVVESGANLTAYRIRQNALTIGSGGTVTLAPSGSGTTSHPTLPNNINFSSSITSLSIAGTTNNWTGTLDIGNNGLAIQYGVGTDPYLTIVNLVRSAYGSGNWTGIGLASSLAKAAVALGSPTPALNIGLIDFIPNGPGFGSSIAFEGQTITTSAVLVRLTYMDDLVLAGDMLQSNATSDALRFAANYGTGTTWSVGDLNHDGTIDSNDALLFAANYVVGLPSLDGTRGNAAALIGYASAIPEPSNMALTALGVLGVSMFRLHRGKNSHQDDRG